MRHNFEYPGNCLLETSLEEHMRLLKETRRSDISPTTEAVNDSSQSSPRIKKELGRVSSLAERLAHRMRRGDITPRWPDDTF